MAVSRFERKIVAAIAAVALMPLIAALVLGQRVLSEAYAVGVNEQVGGEIERGLALYQTHFNALRADAERTSRAVANDVSLNLALSSDLPANEPELRALFANLLKNYQNVVRLELIRAERVLLTTVRPDVGVPSLRLLSLELPLARAPDVLVRVTVGTDARAFGDYQRAGEVSEVFRALKERSAYV